MDLIGDRKIALQNLKQKTPYLAIGWEKIYCLAVDEYTLKSVDQCLK